MRINLLFLLCILCINLSIGYSQSGTIGEHYQKAIEYFESEKYKKSEEEIRKALKIDPEFAEGHNLLGRILIKTKPVLYKLRSELELKRALENDPDNINFIIDLGKFYHDHNDPYKAVNLFEKAKELEPDNPKIHYYLALAKDKKGLTDEAQESANKALEIDPSFEKAKNFLNVVNERQIIFTRAEPDLILYEPKYFDEALEIDESYAEIYFSLGYRNFHEENFDKAKDIFKKIADKAEGHVKSIVFLWMCYQIKGEYEKSRDLFDTYRETLGNSYNFIWQISEMMLPEQDKKKYNSLPEEKKAEFLKKFWKARDPLFASSENEREIEHYKRIAYAMTTFSQDGIKWDRRGEVWIRFGKPSHIEEIAIPPRQIWVYEDLGLTLKFAKFGDRYELFDFDKKTLPYFTRNYTMGLDQIARLENYLMEKSQYAQYIRQSEKTPEYFSFDYGGDAFRIPYYKADFKSSDNKTETEFYYGIPVSYFPQKEGKEITVDNAIVILDEEWNEVFKSVSKEKIISTGKSRGLTDSLIIFKTNAKLKPGQYNLSLEIYDKESGNIGIAREKIKIKSFEESKFDISDIMVAVDMSGAEGETVFTKDGINIFPNPGKQFNRNYPLYVYFEVYNLKIDDRGRTNFRVSTVITRFQKEESGIADIFNSVSKFLGFKKVKGLIENMYDYSDYKIDEKLHYGIDVSELEPGIYTLIIRIKDKNSGKEIESKQSFLLY